MGAQYDRRPTYSAGMSIRRPSPLGGRRPPRDELADFATPDPDAIDDPDRFVIDRPRARQHLSFGFGIHRCVGNRLAEMQVTILWEEILKRFPMIELVSEPKRLYSNFIHGITEMMVRIPA